MKLTAGRVALALLLITIAAGLLAFGVIPSPLLPYARWVFFAAGTLFVPALFLAVLKTPDAQ